MIQTSEYSIPNTKKNIIIIIKPKYYLTKWQTAGAFNSKSREKKIRKAISQIKNQLQPTSSSDKQTVMKGEDKSKLKHIKKCALRPDL